jgi:hypothetical protein
MYTRESRESGMNNGLPGASIRAVCGETAMLRGMGGKDLHFRIRPKVGLWMSDIDQVTNDEGNATKEILRGLLPERRSAGG